MQERYEVGNEEYPMACGDALLEQARVEGIDLGTNEGQPFYEVFCHLMNEAGIEGALEISEKADDAFKVNGFPQSRIDSYSYYRKVVADQIIRRRFGLGHQ